MLVRQRLTLVILVTVGPLVLAACGGELPPGGDSLPSPPGLASPSVAPSTPTTSPDMSAIAGSPTAPVSRNVEAEAAEIASRLTLEQKVGQMMMVGIAGPSLDELSGGAIESHHFGNTALLGRNLESAEGTRTLVAELQKAGAQANGGLGMFVAADLEGGTVWRVPPDVPSFPSARSIGATGSTTIAEEAGAAVGRLALALGVNMDLAPVLDVDDNPMNSVIGSRSYGSDPELVSAVGRAFMKGLLGSGVVPVAKHFPGHGSTLDDPHELLPTVDDSIAMLQAVELEPFRRAIEAGLPAIMTAHVYYPALSGPVPVPATLSREVVTGLLRDEFGFDGVVLSDDFSMGAITREFDSVDAAVRAVNAGVDMIVIAGPIDASREDLINRQIAIHEGIVGAVEDGRISREVVDSAVVRILRLKLAFAVGSEQPNERLEQATREIERLAQLIYDVGAAR